MKIHFSPKDFLKAFKIASSIASAKDVKPVLCNVKVVADKRGGVVLIATDTENGTLDTKVSYRFPGILSRMTNPAIRVQVIVIGIEYPRSSRSNDSMQKFMI